MSNVRQQRAQGAGAADPSVTPPAPDDAADGGSSAPQEERWAPLPWEPSDPARWAHLNLSDPPENGLLPKGALVPDALAFALVAPEAADPVEGIVSGVRVELAALAEALEARGIAAMLVLLARRLDAACLLLRYTDNRARMPMDTEEPEEPSLVDHEHAP